MQPLITFEGIEGCGKTTQMKMAREVLRNHHLPHLLTEEPGGSPLGRRIRQILLQQSPEEICPEAEILLFCAARAQHVRETILPALRRGEWVLCDRFADSTTAYQGYARKLNMDFIQRMHELTLYGRWPDLTLLLDISVDESERRTQQRDGDTPVDRFASENRAFHFAVREGFLDLARHNQKRFRVISADLPVDDVAARIREEQKLSWKQWAKRVEEYLHLLEFFFSPDLFIIGGGVSAAGAVLFDPLRRHLNERLNPHFADKLVIKRAKLGNDAGVIGSAALTFLE